MRFSIKVAALAATTMIMVLVLASAVYGKTDSSDPVTVSATVDNFISINPNTAVTVGLGNIVAQGDSVEESATWEVATNNDKGYRLEVKASGSPAMTKVTDSGTDSFADYIGDGEWSILPASSAFGFSVNGPSDYRGFTGITPIVIVDNDNETARGITTMYFKAQVGSSYLQPSGNYTANLTVTATTSP